MVKISEISKIVLTCAPDAAVFLREELVALGHQIVEEAPSGFTVKGGLGDTYRLNLMLRTAHRVLYLIREFRAVDASGLYKEVSSIPWENYISPKEHLCITSFADTPSIRDSRFANLRCKDAVVDRIRLTRGFRPDSGPDRTGAVVHLHWIDDRCAVYLDTSGEPLSRRGYRTHTTKAPLQETLAASLVIASRWDGDMNFVNPMCGSGTLAIEAALIGLRRPAGLSRSNFGFMHIKSFDRDLWERTLADAGRSERDALPGKIIATDHAPSAIAAAKMNARAAGVDRFIEFVVSDFAETPVPEGGGVVMINPEYGERMGREADLVAVYKGIGDFFKHKCTGYNGFIFTGSPELAKKIGLRTSRKIRFFNGPIECRLLEYQLYAGSRKLRTVQNYRKEDTL